MVRILSFDVGTRNFGICLIDSDPFQILHWEVVDTTAEAPQKHKNIESYKRSLLACLCARRDVLVGPLRAGDHVVIEQQPFGRGTGSPTMNILAHVIGAFFLLSDPHGRPPFTVRQVAARTKLSVEATQWGAPAAGQPEPGQAGEPGARGGRSALGRGP